MNHYLKSKFLFLVQKVFKQKKLSLFITAIYFIFSHNINSEPQIQNFRYSFTKNQMRMVWDLSQDITSNLEYEPVSKTLQIKFDKVKIENSLPILHENPFLYSFTALLFEDSSIKFIFNLKKDFLVKDFHLKSTGVFKNRYVVDLYEKTPIQNESFGLQKTKTNKKEKYLLILDAGHGGKDPGAVGTYGSYEKHIALSIVKRLAKAFQRHPNFQVVLTRNEDVYLELPQRVEKVNQSSADLFLSIHTNASKNSLVFGSSSFILSEKCAIEEARKLLKFNNQDVELAEGYGEKNLLSSIVLNFQVSHLTEKSYKAAEKISKNLSEVTKANKTNVRYSEFYVLRSLKVPSVLVETDFISNPEREILLNTAKYQKRIAKAIYKGVLEYFGFYENQDFSENKN